MNKIQLSGNISSILVDFNSAVVWIVSILPQISNSSSLSSNPLETVSRAPTSIVNLINSFFRSFFIFSVNLVFSLQFSGTAKSSRCQGFFWGGGRVD